MQASALGHLRMVELAELNLARHAGAVLAMLADANVHVRTDALAAVLAALADVMTLDMHT